MDNENKNPPPQTTKVPQTPIDLSKSSAGDISFSKATSPPETANLPTEEASPIIQAKELVTEPAETDSLAPTTPVISIPSVTEAEQKAIIGGVLLKPSESPKMQEPVVKPEITVPFTAPKPAEPEKPIARTEPLRIPLQTPELRPKPPEMPKSSIKAIRTYQADVAESVKGNKTSVAHMVIAEEERRRNLADLESPKSKRNIVFISLSLVLLVIGTVTAIIIFNKSRQTQTEIRAVQNPALIFAENQKHFSVTGLGPEALAKTVGEEVRGANNKLDTIENISFSEKINSTEVPVTTQRFFFFLDNRMPPSLLRSLDSNFMLGVHTFNGNHLFLIFHTNYYENSFAGMLSWEQYMARDLFPIFAIQKSPVSPVFDRPFEDATIKNRDVRVLKDDDGDIVLFYLFTDKKTLVITDSSDTLEEVIRRLNSSKPAVN